MGSGAQHPFYPTQDHRKERTLWVDDVIVTEKPSAREGRLLDASRLTYEPLQHRLEPGDRFEFTVDAKQRLGAATQNAGAVSFHRVAGWTGHPYNKAGKYTLPAETERYPNTVLFQTRYRNVGERTIHIETLYEVAYRLAPGDLWAFHRERLPDGGEYLNLYHTVFDKPECHVARKGGALYYGFFAPGFDGSLEQRGLKDGATYTVTDYLHGREYPAVTATGSAAKLDARFESHLLLNCSRPTSR